jgi:hypothetical protein
VRAYLHTSVAHTDAGERGKRITTRRRLNHANINNRSKISKFSTESLNMKFSREILIPMELKLSHNTVRAPNG